MQFVAAWFRLQEDEHQLILLQQVIESVCRHNGLNETIESRKSEVAVLNAALQGARQLGYHDREAQSLEDQVKARGGPEGFSMQLSEQRQELSIRMSVVNAK